MRWENTAMQRNTHGLRGEEGMTYVFVALGFTVFLGASMLAIDVGMLMTARNQAQNSADAGALAGATALVFDDWADRSAGGPAVTNAIAASTLNQVMRGNVSVNPGDVRFLNNPAGLNNRVQVTVYRSATRGNPLSTLIARYFGMATAGVNAIATAEASPANAETCVKPFTIPDRWRSRLPTSTSDPTTPPATRDTTCSATRGRRSSSRRTTRTRSRRVSTTRTTSRAAWARTTTGGTSRTATRR
ncbi:MAG: hypothetical protein DMF86_23770 [Acidobacteria bacterium]|nr:MAG: hypothetical protein DMF86_23770 [Acidobacteriota bacterium]